VGKIRVFSYGWTVFVVFPMEDNGPKIRQTESFI